MNCPACGSMVELAVGYDFDNQLIKTSLCLQCNANKNKVILAKLKKFLAKPEEQGFYIPNRKTEKGCPHCGSKMKLIAGGFDGAQTMIFQYDCSECIKKFGRKTVFFYMILYPIPFPSKKNIFPSEEDYAQYNAIVALKEGSGWP